MKKIFCILALTSGLCFSAEGTPFCEQERHFQQYQCLIMETSARRIEQILDEYEGEKIDHPIAKEIRKEIGIILFNLALN